MADAQTRKIRVMVADDHPLLRGGVAKLLEEQVDMELVAEASNGQEAVAQFLACRPDVTLMDLRMPGMDGLDAIEEIRAKYHGARIIVLTTYDGDAQAMRALRAGAAGYMLKGMMRTELLDTIRDVHAGKRRIPAEIAMELAEHLTDDSLSEREIEVLRSASHGNSNKRIGAQLGLSEQTIKVHMKSILSKLRANDRTHAVTIALRRGIIEL